MFSIPLLAFSVLAATAPAARSNLVITVCDAGEHHQFETASCDIELKNTGERPIHISDAKAVSQWDKIESSVVVPPHGTAYLKATANIKDSVGYSHRLFRLTTDEPGVLAKRQADMQTFVTTVLDQNVPTIDFGTAKLDEPASAKSVTLTSREVAGFRILSVLAKPDYVDVDIDADGGAVHAKLRKDAPWGLINDKIKLKINSPKQPEAWITLSGNAQGEVVPDNNPISMGLMRTNQKHEYLIRLTSPKGAKFSVGKLTLEGFKGDAKASACTPDAAGCKLVTVYVSNDQTMGRLGGTLSIELPDFQRTLPIRLGGGLLLSPDITIHDVNEESKRANAIEGAQSAVDASAKADAIDVTKAIKQSVEKRDDAPPPGTGPLLRWSVANQTFVFGYVIYRSDSETGPFLRVNDATITKTVDDDGAMSGSYQWRDNSAESGKTYWYSISMIKETGEKVALTGAQKVVAK